MDPLSHLLAGVRAQGAVLHHSVLQPPWALRIEEAAPLTVAIVVSGSAQVRFDDGSWQEFSPGQMSILATPLPYTVCDDAHSPVQLIVRPDAVFLPNGTRLEAPAGPMSCEIDTHGTTTMISGSYSVAGEVSSRLLRALPRMAVVDVPQGGPLVEILLEELRRGATGQQAALDRWLDLALVSALRSYFDDAARAPGWYAAVADPVVGPALRAIHDAPSRPWTISTLARLGLASRTRFAARFTELVGQPPMTYVGHLRLDLAADLLGSKDLTIAAIAARVGYVSPFGFSAAFKRRTGLSPATYRERRAAEGALSQGL